MIDIHCHVLYGVDDGAKDELTSRAMIELMALSGVESVIATPHYRSSMFFYPREEIEEAYERLREYASSLGVRLFPDVSIMSAMTSFNISKKAAYTRWQIPAMS